MLISEIIEYFISGFIFFGFFFALLSAVIYVE